MSRYFTVTLIVQVIDGRQAIKAARAAVRAQNAGSSLPPFPVRSARDAVHWLVDPGASPPGLEIVESFVAESSSSGDAV